MPVEAPSLTDELGWADEAALNAAALQAMGEVGFALLDLDGCVRYWSKGAERMEGYAASAVLGEPFLKGFAPEERAVAVVERWLEEARQTGAFRGHARRVRRDGSAYWAGIDLSLAGAGFAVWLRDESDDCCRWRHVLEENRLLHFMLRSAPVDFWAVTADGEAMGRLPSRWLAGARDASWYGAGQGIRTEDRAAVMAARQDALLQRRPYQVEYRTNEAGDAAAARWVMEEGVPRPGENGRLWGICGYVQDVTPWRRDESASSGFVGELTQEVRRAATTILHTIEVAQEAVPPGERLPLLHGIDQAARELLERVDNVVELGRSPRKNQRRMVSFDPTALVRDVWETAGASAAARGVVLEALLHDALPVRVRGDATGLRQLLRVLLQHAVEAASETAALELRCTPGGLGHTLRIEVTFMGAPLTDGLREWLFSPAAARGDAAMNYGQDGVNLSLAKKVADQMAAAFQIEEEAGATCFRCDVELEPATTQSYRPVASVSLAGRSVLAVAPDRTLRKVLQLRFAALGMRAMTAESGEEAWRLLEEAPAGTFDLMVVQYKLPDMSGNELARRLAAHDIGRELPLATVSMVGEPGQAAAAQEAGFSAYLTPPLPAELLREVLQAMLAQGGAQGELITRFSIAEQRGGDRQAGQ